MRVPLFWRVLPIYALIAAFFVLPIWQHHAVVADTLAAGKAAQADLAIKRATSGVTVSGSPARVVLPRLGIDLPVVSGLYSFTSNKWSVTNLTANYAINTAPPNNQQDKTLIYGHWTPAVFGSTSDLQVGDKAYLYTTNNHIFAYVYISKQVVSPTNTAIFQEFKGKPGLVLMTCQGAWAQERRLMFFELKAAK